MSARSVQITSTDGVTINLDHQAQERLVRLKKMMTLDELAEFYQTTKYQVWLAEFNAWANLFEQEIEGVMA